MDIEKLIEQLKYYGTTYAIGDNLGKEVDGSDELMLNAATALSALQDENEKLRAELEQVKREFDGICEYIDSEGFLRKQFCENGNQDLEPCICPSLQEHPGYIDSDDCEGCDHFCNSWRGQKED